MTYQLITRSAHDTGLEDKSVQCIVTSPPYWGLRKYAGEQGVEWPGVDYAPMPGLDDMYIESMACELGLESTPAQYIGHMVLIMREMRRVLRDDGALWLNMGDSYASTGTSGSQNLDKLGERLGCGGGHQASNNPSGRAPTPSYLKAKQLMGMPWRLAFALQADGWWLRSDIIWHKPNPMPESVTDRPTKGHEYLFLLAKSKRYYYDADAVREEHVRLWDESNRRGIYAKKGGDRTDTDDGHVVLPHPAGRNRRTVWTIATQPTPFAHFATFPEKLVEPCILAGSKVGDTVLDPFSGSGTVGMVATRHGRNYIGIDINQEYHDSIAKGRIGNV